MTDLSTLPVERLALTFAPQPWPFAEIRRGEIDQYFAALKREKPALWNGRVLLLDRHAMAGRVFRGRFFETDYASFLAWRNWGFPDAGAVNCFAMGALRAADGAYLLGVMSAGTANSGRVYFPGGTPEPEDVVGQAVDLERNVWRELEEETGLRAEALAAEDGWHAVFEGPRIALLKILRSHEDAGVLRARILAHLAAQPEAELSDIRIVRGPADLDPMMPAFVTAFPRQAWTGS